MNCYSDDRTRESREDLNPESRKACEELSIAWAATDAAARQVFIHEHDLRYLLARDVKRNEARERLEEELERVLLNGEPGSTENSMPEVAKTDTRKRIEIELDRIFDPDARDHHLVRAVASREDLSPKSLRACENLAKAWDAADFVAGNVFLREQLKPDSRRALEELTRAWTAMNGQAFALFERENYLSCEFY